MAMPAGVQVAVAGKDVSAFVSQVEVRRTFGGMQRVKIEVELPDIALVSPSWSPTPAVPAAPTRAGVEPIWKRKRFYCARVDAADGSPEHVECEPDQEANLTSSLCDDGLHRPALDIDIPCELIPSTTPGHGHLYFPELAMSWEKYQGFMNQLAYYGVLDMAYVRHSVDKGSSMLRLPNHPKTPRSGASHWIRP